MRQRGERWTVATATTSGGDDGARLREREGGRGGDGDEQAVEGGEGEYVAPLGASSGEHVTRRWPRACWRAAATRSRPPGEGGRRQGGGRWAGPYSAKTGRPAQVALFLSLSVF